MKMSREIAHVGPSSDVSVGAVATLLGSLFSTADALHFVDDHYPFLREELPSGVVAPRDFFDAWAHSLIRQGLINDEFRISLCNSRPHRVNCIHLALGKRPPPEGPSQRGHVEFTLAGNLEEFTPEKMENLLGTLRSLMGESSFVVINIKSGSVKVTLSATPEDCAKLRSIVREMGVERFGKLMSESLRMDLLSADLGAETLRREMAKSRFRARLLRPPAPIVIPAWVVLLLARRVNPLDESDTVLESPTLP